MNMSIGKIGDDLYANYSGTEKSRDKDLITRVYNAVIAATIDELGEDAARDALKTWKDGDAVPAPVEEKFAKYFGYFGRRNFRKKLYIIRL